MLETLMPIGDRLKELRKAKGLTQLQLSQASGLSLSIITQIEQGLTADPRLSTLRGFGKALGVSLDALVGEEEETPPKQPKEPPAPGKRPGRRPKK
jgi:transcriptional regulator with XRE-family HTH domain